MFFKSLAEDQAERSIAVVLSGTGSDGMRGIKAIKEAGGMIMVQNEESAKFDGMPKSAISTGLADFILPPSEMPKHLLNYVKHPYIAKTEKAEPITSNEEGIDRIFALLRARTKLDFTFYKPSTVSRRIERRISVNHLDGLKEYVEFLERNSSEVHALYRELLIGVTNFFRDKEAFSILETKVLPSLLAERQGRPLRFWVAGCSSGDEAYSLAILTRQCLEVLGAKTVVKIFATDVDRDAIMDAGNGIFPESIAADLTPEQISKYFIRRNNSYEITREIREMVVFAQHNLIKDPPFNNIDFLSCRNLMIYLQPVLQAKVLQMFNFALNPGGILFLGSSETPGEMSDYFEPVNHKWKIYSSRGKRKPIDDPHEIPIPENALARSFPIRYERGFHSYRQREERLLERILEVLAGEFVPLTMIVNDEMELIYALGDTYGYFKVPSGKAQSDLSKMAVNELRVPLSTGIPKAFKSGREIKYSNIKLNANGQKKIIQLRIKPLNKKVGIDNLAAVFLIEEAIMQETKQDDLQQVFDVGKEVEQRIIDLESELQFTKENLQATIEELETSNEELQATNEELLSSNEELQSTNEELQSVNEELHTVNAEHQSKIFELTELNNDMDNMLASTDIATLFLNENLEIRKFTPRISEIFKIMDQDISRPVGHLTNRIVDCDPIEIIEQVNKTKFAEEVEVKTDQGRWYLMRVLPYKVAKDVYSGVVATFIDIGTIKDTRARLADSEEHYRLLFETMSQGVVYQNAKGEIISANPAAEKILGLSLDQMQGRKSTDPRWKTIREDGSDFPGDSHPSMTALKSGKELKGKIMGVYHPRHKKHRWITVNAVPLYKPGAKKPYCVYSTFEDITETKKAAVDLHESHKRYDELFKKMRSGAAYHRILLDNKGKPVDYEFLDINRAFTRLTGLKRKDVIGKKVTEIIPDIKDSETDWIAVYGSVALSGESTVFDAYLESLQKHYKITAYSPQKEFFIAIFEESGS